MQIQGPKSKAVLVDLLGESVLEIPYYFCHDYELEGMDLLVSRTGYTSEIGFEIYCRDASRNALKLWDLVLEAGKPHGLAVIGPCHIRRIEGGILAYGADMWLDTNPYEVEMGYEWMVDLGQEADFVGKQALRRIKQAVIWRKLVGVEIGVKKVWSFIGGAAGGVTGAVGMSAGARERAAIDDQVFLADRTTLKPALQDLAHSGRIAGLRGQGRPRHVWRHPVVGHRPPGVIPRSRLREPDITGIAGKLAAFQCPRDRVAVADLAAGGVDDVGAALHLGDEGVVEEVLGLRMEGRVDRDHVADGHHRLGVRVVGYAELALDLLRESVSIGVVQSHLKRLQPPEDSGADPAGSDRPDLHSLQVVRPGDAVGDVPAALDDPLIGRDVVAHQRQDHHHHMLGDADAVRIGDLADGDPPLDRRFQINVVGADPRRDSQPQRRRLRDPLRRQVGRPERLRDDDRSLRQLSLEDRVRPVLVRGDNKRVAALLEEPPQPKLPGNAAQKLTRLEVDPLGGRRGLTVVVAPDPGNRISRVRPRIPLNRIVVEDTENLRHPCLTFSPGRSRGQPILDRSRPGGASACARRRAL